MSTTKNDVRISAAYERGYVAGRCVPATRASNVRDSLEHASLMLSLGDKLGIGDDASTAVNRAELRVIVNTLHAILESIDRPV